MESWLEALRPEQVHDRLLEVLKLARHRLTLVRLAAVRALASCRTVSATVFRDLLSHEGDFLVRIELLETLGARRDRGSVRRLRRIARESRQPLERAAAITALSEILAPRDRRFFELLRDTEKNPRVKVNLDVALSRRGDKAAFDHLLSLLGNGSYIVRCSTANSLWEVTNGRVKARVVVALRAALAKEKTRAARSSLETALSDLGGV